METGQSLTACGPVKECSNSSFLVPVIVAVSVVLFLGVLITIGLVRWSRQKKSAIIAKEQKRNDELIYEPGWQYDPVQGCYIVPSNDSAVTTNVEQPVEADPSVFLYTKSYEENRTFSNQ
jgi:type II secretory pathway pseudopilin PulG